MLGANPNPDNLKTFGAGNGDNSFYIIPLFENLKIFGTYFEN